MMRSKKYLRPAFAADTVEVHAVILGMESISCKEFFLQLLDLRFHHFNNLPAPGTDEVIVMLMPEQVFVPRRPILEPYLAAQSAFTQQ